MLRTVNTRNERISCRTASEYCKVKSLPVETEGKTISDCRKSCSQVLEVIVGRSGGQRTVCGYILCFSFRIDTGILESAEVPYRITLLEISFKFVVREVLAGNMTYGWLQVRNLIVES